MKVRIYSGWDYFTARTIDAENCTREHQAYMRDPMMDMVDEMRKWGFNVTEDKFEMSDGSTHGYYIKEPLIMESYDIEKLIITLIEVFKCKVSVDYKNGEWAMILMFGGSEYDDIEGI